MKSKLIKPSSKIFLGLVLILVLATLTATLATASADITKQKPIQQVSGDGVTVSLMSINIKSTRAEPTMCIDLPDNADWFPYAYLEVGKNRVAVDTIALVNAKNPATYQSSRRCYEFGFPTGIARGVGQVKIVVEKIQTSLPESLTQEMCIQAQENLRVDYPEFSFACNIGTQGVGFTVSSKPATITDDQANQLIVGALTRTVEGPWALTYNVP